jgi:hypothetical protein
MNGPRHQFPFEEKPEEIPAGYVWCDDRRELVRERECMIKHISAVKKKERNDQAGRPTGYNPCLSCPEGILQYDQAKRRDAQRENQTPTPPTQSKTEDQETKEEDRLMNNKRRTRTAPPTTSVYVTGTCSGCGMIRKVFKKRGICQACLRAEKSGFSNAKPPQQTNERQPIDASGMVITIPANMAQKLRRFAILKYRTPEQQALWILKKAVGEPA